MAQDQLIILTGLTVCVTADLQADGTDLWAMLEASCWITILDCDQIRLDVKLTLLAGLTGCIQVLLMGKFQELFVLFGGRIITLVIQY